MKHYKPEMGLSLNITKTSIPHY